MRAAINVQGGGIAACCCARLLTGRGVPTYYAESARSQSPTLLISPATAHLLRDVFGDDAFLQGLHRIEKRIVAWQPGAPPVSLPHAGWVAPEAHLLRELWQRVPPAAEPATPLSLEDSVWQVFSSGAPQGLAFGERMASALSVKLRDTSDPAACSIEAVRDGWLFLLPSGYGVGSLLCVGENTEKLLEQSQLVSAQLSAVNGASGRFPAAPYLADTLTGPQWLACGTAALRFDPVCGEGVGNSVREAILAAATLAAIRQGEIGAAVALLENYETRLRAGFNRHIGLCEQFYQTGDQGEWWEAQRERLLKERLRARTFDRQVAVKYRLRGFALELLSA